MEDGLALQLTDGSEIEAKKAIICIPPQLANARISFSPALPGSLTHILPDVQTWMAGAVKFAIEYDDAFWRREGYSGMLYSHAGMIKEMYDHCNFEENKFGFTGFLGNGAAAYSQEVRKEFVLRQLTELLGERASEPSSYVDKIGNEQFLVAGSQAIHRPHQNNGHPLLQQSYMNERLYFAATETASEFAGYMEGAVIAAESVAERL